MSGRTKNEIFRENEELRQEMARLEKRQADFLTNEKDMSDTIDAQAGDIAALQKEISQNAQIIAEYRLTCFGQAHILTRSLYPKVQASMPSGIKGDE